MNLFSQTYNHSSQSEYTLRIASYQDAEKIHEVMVQASRTLENKDYFICDDLKYVKKLLNQEGFGIVACDTSGNVVGNLLLKYPGLTDENLGYDIFPDYFSSLTQQEILPVHDFFQKELQKVVHMDSASVLPAHRGHHLESRMIAFAENLIDTGKYIYAFATVAPSNTASLKSLERNGYRTMITKEKYGGVMRCIMMKKLDA